MYKAKPATIKKLKQVVEEFARSLSEDEVRRMTGNITKRIPLCIEQNGAHFQQLMK